MIAIIHFLFFRGLEKFILEPQSFCVELSLKYFEVSPSFLFCPCILMSLFVSPFIIISVWLINVKCVITLTSCQLSTFKFGSFALF